MKENMKKIGIIGIMFCFLIANVFAHNSDISVGEDKFFYANKNKIETEKEFKLVLTNRYEYALKLDYKSEFCVLDLPEKIENGRLEVNGYCLKSDNIIIFGNKDNINIRVNIISNELPPIEPPEEPPIVEPTKKISSGRNLTQEGIKKYGKENFENIIQNISKYKKEYDIKCFYWKNSKSFDITYLDYIDDRGYKHYTILESIKLE